MFTAKELESLEKKIADVEKWRDDKLEEQEKMPLSEMPKLTVSLIKSKVWNIEGNLEHQFRLLFLSDSRSGQRSSAFDRKGKNDQS